MNADRFFMDTAFVLALLNPKDPFHDEAKALIPRVKAAREVWLHDGILIEVANSLAGKDRQAAADFIERVYKTANTKIAALTRKLVKRALELYGKRHDKAWGLTDCISFVLMQEEGLSDALTMDHHFEQAGFRIMLIKQS